MLAHRLRRWPNIETALGECPVFARNPLNHHNAPKYHLASLKNDLISRFRTSRELRHQYIAPILAYQYIAIFFNFATTSNHLHSLQVENCDRNSWLVVDGVHEDNNVNSGLKGYHMTCSRLSSWWCMTLFMDPPIITPDTEHDKI